MLHLLYLNVGICLNKVHGPVKLAAGNTQKHAAVDLPGQPLGAGGDDIAVDALLRRQPGHQGNTGGLAVPENKPHTALRRRIGHQGIGPAGEYQPPAGCGLGGGKHRRYQALLCHLAAVQNGDLIADFLHHAHLVGDDDHGDAQLPVQLPDQLEDLVGGVGIQGTGGLVAQQHLGLGG